MSGLQGWVLAVLAAAVLVGVASARSHRSTEWDAFVFTQDWPPGVKIEAEETHHKFNITKDVKGWVIHGLWPTLSGTDGPQDCNKSWPFDFSKIANLTQQLNSTWPNMYGDTPRLDFWQHEWEKHGTCATSLPATSSEYLYFSKTLQLAERFNFLRLLGSVGIYPDMNRKYKTDVMYSTILKLNENKKFFLQCVSDKNDKNYMYAVELCMNKNFTLIDCELTHHYRQRSNPYIRECSKHYEMTYAPITY